MIISRDICLRRKKKEREPSDTVSIENNEWYQIKSEGWEGGSLRHNTMNTTDPFLPVTQTLPVASPGETMEVEDPIFSAGVEEGHYYSLHQKIPKLSKNLTKSIVKEKYIRKWGKGLEITLNALFFFMQQKKKKKRKHLEKQTCSWAPGLL